MPSASPASQKFRMGCRDQIHLRYRASQAKRLAFVHQRDQQFRAHPNVCDFQAHELLHALLIGAGHRTLHADAAVLAFGNVSSALLALLGIRLMIDPGKRDSMGKFKPRITSILHAVTHVAMPYHIVLPALSTIKPSKLSFPLSLTLTEAKS